MAFCERKLAHGTMWHVKKFYICFVFLFLSFFFFFFFFFFFSSILHIECFLLCFLVSFFLLFFFFLSLCFLDNAYWMLFPVLAAFVVDRFVIFFMSKGSGDLKIVKDTLSTSVYGLNAVRVSPCTVKGSKGWLCLYLSTPRQLLSPSKAIKSVSWYLNFLILNFCNPDHYMTSWRRVGVSYCK